MLAKRMGAPRLAETANQCVVAGFDENEGCRMIGRKFTVNPWKLFELRALARIHQQSSAFDFAGTFAVQFAESGNQCDRKIVNAVVTEVFKRIQHRTFSGAG